ncbi:ABC transporter permease [Nonomuraea sp. NPDC050783]|uniref:ABC transporter permease n=1 Tax=Nonomuraea sp. NPDC050783 TaxID=3154634 RepID=UPI0034673ACD
MSTADTRTQAGPASPEGEPPDGAQPRRMPGLVPVTETLRTVERRPPEPLPEPLPGAPGEAVPARRPGAFWRLLASELGLTFRRPRNMALLAVLGVVPIILGIGLRVAAGTPADGDEGMGGLIQDVAGNNLMLTFLSFSFLVLLLMPVAVSVVAGDAIAGEAGGGTLRYLLAAPAGRTRLLVVKYLNAVVFAYAATAVVAVSALLTGLALFPGGTVTLLSGTTITTGEGLLRILIAAGYVGAGMAALAAVALALSTFTEVAIGAIAGTMVLVVVCQVLRAVPDLAPIAPYLLPTRFTDFDAVLRSPIDLASLRDGLLSFAAYIALFGSIAWARFTGKDITS